MFSVYLPNNKCRPKIISAGEELAAGCEGRGGYLGCRWSSPYGHFHGIYRTGSWGMGTGKWEVGSSPRRAWDTRAKASKYTYAFTRELLIIISNYSTGNIHPLVFLLNKYSPSNNTFSKPAVKGRWHYISQRWRYIN